MNRGLEGGKALLFQLVGLQGRASIRGSVYPAVCGFVPKAPAGEGGGLPQGEIKRSYLDICRLT